MPDHATAEVQISVEGEHDGLHTLVLKKGATLGDLKKL